MAASAGGGSSAAAAVGRSLGKLMRSGAPGSTKEVMNGILAHTPPGVVKFNPVRLVVVGGRWLAARRSCSLTPPLPRTLVEHRVRVCMRSAKGVVSAWARRMNQQDADCGTACMRWPCIIICIIIMYICVGGAGQLQPGSLALCLAPALGRPTTTTSA